jgi:hypothetical protein
LDRPVGLKMKIRIRMKTEIKGASRQNGKVWRMVLCEMLVLEGRVWIVAYGEVWLNSRP